MENINYGIIPPTGSVIISSMSITYKQPPDCTQDEYDDDDEITFTVKNGGVSALDAFYIIETKKWAFDNIEELRILLNDFKKRLNNEVQKHDEKA